MNYKKMTLPMGHTTLNVLTIGRVSTEHQDITNIQAGYGYAEKVLPEIWEGLSYIKRLGEQASGMLANRKTILEAMELIESGWPHVVLMEDVSKTYRNPRWIYAFVQDCVDRGIRVIALGDMLDTWDDNWEVTLGTAALRHGLHIPDTRRRIRRTSSHTFSQGGMVLRVRAGYRKLTKEEATSGQFGPKGLRLAKLPEWTEIYRTLRERVVHDKCGGALLAQWLNTQEPPIPVPPYCKQKHWNGRLVLDLLRDPLLYGLRQFPKVRHEPRFGDGKHKRLKNASPQIQHYPELAHMSEVEFREMGAVLDAIGGKEKESQRAGLNSPRFRIARSQTLTPLQHVTCAACGDLYYLVGHNVIKCSNALKHTAGGCWNHVQVSCQIIRQKLVDILLEKLETNPAAKQAFLDAAWEQIEHAQLNGRRSADDLDQQIGELRSQEERTANAIAEGGMLESLVQKLRTLECARKKLEKQKRDLTEDTTRARHPVSRDTLAIDPKEALLELANSSFKFASLMRKIIPKFVIEPVQALDCGQVRPRGRLTMDLSRLLQNWTGDDHVDSPELVIEFFNRPKHIKYLDHVVASRDLRVLQGQTHSLDVLARKLGIGRMTVKRALAYRKLMNAAELREPYRVLIQAPQAASRWKPRKARASSQSVSLQA